MCKFRTVTRFLTVAVLVPIATVFAAQTDSPTRMIESYDRLQMGREFEGQIVVPTNQVLAPAGRLVQFPGRPTDVDLSPDGRWLAVLNRHTLVILDVQKGAIASEVAHRGGSWTGVVFEPYNRRVYASSFSGSIGVFGVDENGQAEPLEPIAIGGERPVPAGLALSVDAKRLWVALNLRDSVAEIDLATGEVLRTIDVGAAPYDVAIAGERLLVSNWGGRRPAEGDLTGRAGRGSPVRVDPRRHIASDGSVSIIDTTSGEVEAELAVGLHPSGMAVSPDGRFVAVANANSDTVSVVDTRLLEVVETIDVRLGEESLFGSAPNAVAFDSEAKRLFASNGTNNAVAVIAFSPGASRLAGFVPTAWYPAGLAYDARRDQLYVANVKGVGSRNTDWRRKRKIGDRVVFGYNSHDYQGAVSLIPVPANQETLEEHTQTVRANNRYTEQLSALAPPRDGVAPKPVPERHGEPSLFKHVVYIIKENRTYDQIFGDIKRGEGDPDLCIFGRRVTPNCHKLVDEFLLLDNFYCSGTLSADGHQWTDEAYVTDYIEKAYGGWPRSYPYDGGDALAYASSGFLWDNALAHGKTIRVYGEFVNATIRWRDPNKTERPTFLDCYRDFVAGTDLIEIHANAAIASLEPFLCPTAIGFPGIVPDVHRAKQFIDELAEFEKSGDMPNLSIMLLPNDHTAGTRPGMPTPDAAVADNDLALGRIIEALSKSRFWRDTVVFVVQDDPQAGFDHVDGRRTVAMVISPYTRRGGAVDSTNYNQTSMVRTIELCLGLPPMNQLDASATPMTSCFTDKPDLAPYEAMPNEVPLDQMNPDPAAITDPAQKRWALVSQSLPLEDIDEADEDTLNRILWHATRGDDASYPTWAVAAE